MKVHGLHLKAICSPYNIPFWGPGAMYNPLVMLNLQKIEKNLPKNYILVILRLLEAKLQNYFFLFWILSKNGGASEGIFWIGGLTNKIKKFFSQFSGADFSLVIDFWVKWTSISLRAWSQHSKMVWHLTFQWKVSGL